MSPGENSVLRCGEKPISLHRVLRLQTDRVLGLAPSEGSQESESVQSLEPAEGPLVRRVNRMVLFLEVQLL